MASIRLLNGRLVFDAQGDIDLLQWMSERHWLEQDPNKREVYFCYPFKEVRDAMRIDMKPVWNRFTVQDKALHKLQNIQYNRKRSTPLQIKNIPGITLESYQEKAVTCMAENHDFCIFLGPGTGKTLIALTFLNSLNAPGVYVVVTPKKVITQYANEARKYLSSDWEVCEARLPTTQKALIVLNYEAVSLVMGLPKIKALILDESHRVKNPDSQVNKRYLRELGKVSENIYLFTGTPQDAMPTDIFGQFAIFNPDLIGAFSFFRSYFFLVDDYKKPTGLKPGRVLENVIKEVSFGGMTQDLLDLPERIEHRIKCDKPDPLYKILDTKKLFVTDDNREIVVDSMGKRIVKLRQIANGHIKLDNGDPYPIFNPKARAMQSLIATLPHGIIYTQFDTDIEIVSELLTSQDRTFVCVNGKTKQAGPLIESFKQGQVEFMVIQAQSGNAGLDLTNTNNIIFYSLPLSFIVYEQCLFRVWRRGQTLDCHYYYLMVPGTIETDIFATLRKKKSYSVAMFKNYEGD